MSRGKRTDADYEIEALTKGLIVLEALEGGRFEPVSVKTIQDRTGYSRDLIDRTLKTLRMRGYAVRNDDGFWSMGPRVTKLSGRYSDLALVAISKGAN